MITFVYVHDHTCVRRGMEWRESMPVSYGVYHLPNPPVCADTSMELKLVSVEKGVEFW